MIYDMPLNQKITFNGFGESAYSGHNSGCSNNCGNSFGVGHSNGQDGRVACSFVKSKTDSNWSFGSNLRD